MNLVAKPYMAGQFCDRIRQTQVIDPFTGETCGLMQHAEPEDIESAFQNAFAFHKEYSRTNPFLRARWLEEIASVINKNSDRFAQAICAEAGKPIRFARAEVERAIATFKLSATAAIEQEGALRSYPGDNTQSKYGLTKLVSRGVVAAITPFNFPLNLVAHKVAPAIAAGAPVIFKPASATPLTAQLLSECIQQTSIPIFAYQMLPMPGELATRLASKCQVVSLTGSSEVGWKLKSILSPHIQVVLELGGNAGCVIDSGQPIEKIIPSIATSGFAYSGQVCISLQRLFVQEDEFDEYWSKLCIFIAEKIFHGDPREETTSVGPIIDQKSYNRIFDLIESAKESGATVWQLDEIERCTKPPYMIPPTLITNVSSDHPISTEEIFGPVIIIDRYKDWPEAICKLNNSKYGLQASIYTNDLKKVFQAFNEIETGTVNVNEPTNYRFDGMPYGGTKLSGWGREGIKYTIQSYCELKHMVVNWQLGS